MKLPDNPAEMPVFIEQQFARMMHNDPMAGYICRRASSLGLSVEQLSKLIAVHLSENNEELRRKVLKLALGEPLVLHTKDTWKCYGPARSTQ